MKILQQRDWTNRARERMKAQKIRNDALGRALGVTTASISHYLTGRRDPSLTQLAMIAKALKMSPVELVYGDAAHYSAIPLLTWTDIPTLKTGKDDAFRTNAKKKIPYFHAEHSEIYALRVPDDSMFSPLSLAQSFREHSIIIVDPTKKTPQENQFVIATYKSSRQQEEAFLRQYVKTQGKYYLKPINQQYSMVVVDKTIELKGTVIAQVAIYE